MADKLETKIKFPAGLSPEEEAQWWDDHPEYWDQFDDSDLEVREPGPEGRTVRLPYMRLPEALVDGIYKIAVAGDMTTAQLIQQWLEERLEAERGQSAVKKRRRAKQP